MASIEAVSSVMAYQAQTAVKPQTTAKPQAAAGAQTAVNPQTAAKPKTVSSVNTEVPENAQTVSAEEAAAGVFRPQAEGEKGKGGNAGGGQAQTAKQFQQAAGVKQIQQNAKQIQQEAAAKQAEMIAKQVQQAQEAKQAAAAKQSEQIKKAVAEMNKKINNTNEEAVFGIHEDTNRITIKIMDKETKEVIKEFPPEKTLDMIARIWEVAGILVDEKL